ncbi:hypothetical protein [Microbispora sp. NPDC049125]|uniref:hypothetical protein n=1 Tax=Microbispora sp. NPDC049125 TaxID=3154929 RepID=UPI003467E16B
MPFPLVPVGAPLGFIRADALRADHQIIGHVKNRGHVILGTVVKVDRQDEEGFVWVTTKEGEDAGRQPVLYDADDQVRVITLRMVLCDTHEGAHDETPECHYPHEITGNGAQQQVGHPLRCTD